MDVTKAQVAITSARNEIKALIDDAIKVRNFNPLRSLTGVDAVLEKAAEKLAEATKKAAPRARKSRAERKAAKKAA